jgi:hypothetical protein
MLLWTRIGVMPMACPSGSPRSMQRLRAKASGLPQAAQKTSGKRSFCYRFRPAELRLLYAVFRARSLISCAHSARPVSHLFECAMFLVFSINYLRVNWPEKL